MTSNPRKFRVTEEEYNILQLAKVRDSTLYKDQIIYERDRQIKLKKLRILQKEREINFKKAEMSNGESLEYHQNYINNKKPLFHIENDIEEIQLEIEELLRQIKEMEKLQEENV